MHPTLFSFPPPSQASLIHFFQNRPRSNIMIKLPHLHEASKNWLQASHTFKTTLPSRIKYVIYFSLLQEKANRKGKEGENNPKKPIKHTMSNKYLESSLTQTLLPISFHSQLSLLSYQHCTNSLPGPTACLRC